MRSDISVLQGKQIVAIVDVKWKVLSPEERKLVIASADLYQLVSYAQRYQCQRLALIYSAIEGVSPGLRDRLSIQGSDVQIDIFCIDFIWGFPKEGAAFE